METEKFIPNPLGVRDKLNPEHKKMVVWMRSRGFQYLEIVDKLKKDFNIEISIPALSELCKTKKYRAILARLSRRYEDDIKRIPISKAKNRLLLLEGVIQRALEWTTTHVGEFGEIQAQQLGIVVQAMKEARAEIKGDPALQIAMHQHYHLGELREKNGVEEGELIRGFNNRLSQNTVKKSTL